MEEYTLVAQDGTAYDLEGVVIDDINDTVTFVAPFQTAPPGTSHLRRNRDGATIPVFLNSFNLSNGQITWSAVALVGRR